jgi:hypothetical protein
VKLTAYIALFSGMFLLTACPPSRRSSYQSNLKQVKKNGMDFPNLRSERYEGIEYQLSELFSYDYDDDYVKTDYATTKCIYDMDIHFSVEMFDENDAEAVAYAFDDEIGLLDAVHDDYILTRQESLESPSTSIKKVLPKSVGYPGYIQIVHGAKSSYSDKNSYFTATLEVDDEYYVFQLIGKEENMGYMYDDFIDIISSVQK